MVYGRVSFGVGTVVSELSGAAPPVYLKCVGVVVSTVVKLTQVSVSIYCGGWGGGAYPLLLAQWGAGAL